jgi:hypothetical protein
MNNKTVGSVHWSFWVIGTIMLIWNVMGAMNFLWQFNADANSLASLPETHRAIIIGRPLWATGGFAIGVFVGALGCLLLLLKKSAAYYLFVVSLLGMIVTMIHTIGIASLTIDFSPFEIFIMILMPLVVAVFLIWYSTLAKSKGWVS